MPLSPGGKFGPFELIAPIGRDGRGGVWKARDTRLDRLVAMKISGDERVASAIPAVNYWMVMSVPACVVWPL